MVTSARYVRIDEARCPRCGPKAALLANGKRYELPIQMSAAVVERAPWVCGDCVRRYDVRRKLELTVEVIEG